MAEVPHSVKKQRIFSFETLLKRVNIPFKFHHRISDNGKSPGLIKCELFVIAPLEHFLDFFVPKFAHKTSTGKVMWSQIQHYDFLYARQVSVGKVGKHF
jgi:hypothetical protein